MFSVNEICSMIEARAIKTFGEFVTLEDFKSYGTVVAVCGKIGEVGDINFLCKMKDLKVPISFDNYITILISNLGSKSATMWICEDIIKRHIDSDIDDFIDYVKNSTDLHNDKFKFKIIELCLTQKEIWKRNKEEENEY